MAIKKVVLLAWLGLKSVTEVGVAGFKMIVSPKVDTKPSKRSDSFRPLRRS